MQKWAGEGEETGTGPESLHEGVNSIQKLLLKATLSRAINRGVSYSSWPPCIYKSLHDTNGNRVCYTNAYLVSSIAGTGNYGSRITCGLLLGPLERPLVESKFYRANRFILMNTSGSPLTFIFSNKVCAIVINNRSLALRANL